MSASGVSNAYNVHRGKPRPQKQTITNQYSPCLPTAASSNGHPGHCHKAPIIIRTHTYILVVSNYFTRWTEAYALPNQEAETVAHKLVDEFFFRFSVSEQLHSDQGTQFESTTINKVSRLLQINKNRTTPYHPQSDGLMERFNCTLLSMLATTIVDYPWDWEDNIHQLCYAYYTSIHSSTGYAPFFLMFGCQARLPVDLSFQLP